MSPEAEVAAVRALVRGRVQGVGFRFFVQREAERLGLAGYARNLADGSSVEVAVEGRREAIESLLVALGRGPRMAQVADVSFEWTSAEGRRGFEVR